MIDMAVLGRQMEMFTTLIVIGIFMQKTRMMTDDNIKGLSSLLTKLIIPCLMLTLMPNGGSASDMMRMWPVAVASFGYIISMFIIAYLSTCFLSFRTTAARQTHVLLCAAGNAGFIGVPLIAALLPHEAGGSAIYTLIEAVICWTVGPALLSASANSASSVLSHGSARPHFRNLLSPIVLSILIGFLMTLMNIHPSDNVVWDTLTAIGGTTKYFSCIYIGLCVGQAGLKGLLRDKKVFLSSVLKLIVFPLALYLVLSRIPVFTADQVSLFLILGATPSAVSVPLLASTYSGDTEYATSGVLINTMLSILTIPLVVGITRML